MATGNESASTPGKPMSTPNKPPRSSSSSSSLSHSRSKSDVTGESSSTATSKGKKKKSPRSVSPSLSSSDPPSTPKEKGVGRRERKREKSKSRKGSSRTRSSRSVGRKKEKERNTTSSSSSSSSRRSSSKGRKPRVRSVSPHSRSSRPSRKLNYGGSVTDVGTDTEDDEEKKNSMGKGSYAALSLTGTFKLGATQPLIKPISITVFQNKDPHGEGTEFVIGKAFTSLDKFLLKLTESLSLSLGPFKQLFEVSGTVNDLKFKPILRIEDLEEDGIYVACGTEKIDKKHLPASIVMSMFVRMKGGGSKRRLKEGNKEIE